MNQQKEPEQDVDEDGVLGPMAASALQGGAFNFGDEIGGALSATASKIGGDNRPFGDIYASQRDDLRKYLDKAVDSHRASNIAGGLASGIGAAKVAGMAFNALRGAGAASTAANTANTAKTAMTVGQGAKTAAKAGGISSGAQSIGDAKDFSPESMAKAAFQTGVGAAAGGVLGAGSAKLGQYLTPERWQTVARKFGLFSAGELAKKQSKELGREGIEETADYLLNNVLPQIPLSQRTRAGVASKVERMLSEKGEYLGNAISDPIDDLMKTLGQPGGI